MQSSLQIELSQNHYALEFSFFTFGWIHLVGKNVMKIEPNEDLLFKSEEKYY